MERVFELDRRGLVLLDRSEMSQVGVEVEKKRARAKLMQGTDKRAGRVVKRPNAERKSTQVLHTSECSVSNGPGVQVLEEGASLRDGGAKGRRPLWRQ